MARILTAGAEFGDIAADGFTVWSGGIGNYVTTSAPTTPYGRKSDYSFYCSNSVGLEYDFEPEFPGGLNEIYMRMHFWPGNRTDGTWEILRLTTNDGSIMLRWSVTDLGSGTVNGARYYNGFYNSAGSQFVTASGFGYRNSEYTLYELHVKFGGSGARLRLKANGFQIIDWTGSLTGPGAESTFHKFRPYQAIISGGGARTHYYDNIAINDTTGTINNSWIGDGYILPFYPNGNGGTSNFVNSERSSTDNFKFINRRRAYNAVGFVAPTAALDKDTYTIDKMHDEFHGVNAIKVEGLTVRHGTAITQARMLVQPPVQAEIQSAALAVPQGAEGYIRANFSHNTNTGQPFTIAELNAAETGIQFLA